MLKMRMGLSSTAVFVFVLAICAMRIASTPTANLSYLLLAAYALLGRTQAIQALAMSWLFTMLSPGIGAEATQASVGRYAVFFGAALSVFLRGGLLHGKLKLRAPVVYTVGLGVVFVVHSLFFSPMPDVSIFKAVSWTVVMATLMSAWQGLSAVERDKLAGQLFNGLVVVMLVSLPLLFLPLGYLRNGSGFQGILNHPQVFGPAMALLGTWAASQLFGQRRPPWKAIVLVGATLVLVILSEARTAGLALLIGVAVAIVSAPPLSGKSLRVVMPGLKSRRVWVVLGGALFMSLAFAPRLVDVATGYISKSGRAEQVDSLIDAYDSSRGALIKRMWANIQQKPLTGIGFGIASRSHEMQVVRDPVFNLPVSASIEKGVLPIAVLEELGVVGAALVAVWLLMLLRRGAKGGVTPLAIITTVLLLNMGESTFFSPGGLGLLCLVLVGWACSVPRQRARQADRALSAPGLSYGVTS